MHVGLIVSCREIPFKLSCQLTRRVQQLRLKSYPTGDPVGERTGGWLWDASFPPGPNYFCFFSFSSQQMPRGVCCGLWSSSFRAAWALSVQRWKCSWDCCLRLETMLATSYLQVDGLTAQHLRISPAASHLYAGLSRVGLCGWWAYKEGIVFAFCLWITVSEPLWKLERQAL